MPLPPGVSRAFLEALCEDQPITLTCAGRSWTAAPAEISTFQGWVDAYRNAAMLSELKNQKRGRGRPREIDWWGMLSRLMSAVDSGEALDAALARLRVRYGMQSLAEAHRWVKDQRQASTARLRELERKRFTGNVPDWEGNFHRAVLRCFPPRRAGRPPGRKSGR